MSWTPHNSTLTLRYNCGSISNPMNQIGLISFDGEGTLRTFDFGQMVWREAIPAIHAQKKGSDLTQVKKAVAIEPYFTHIFSSTFHYKQLKTPILTLGCA
jgi:hypothetical protein